MYCKYCGMESDSDRVCSWCKRPLAAPAQAGQQVQAVAPQTPPPPPPPRLTGLAGGMAVLGADEVPAGPPSPLAAGGELSGLGGQMPGVPGMEQGLPAPPLLAGPDDLPGVPELEPTEPRREGLPPRAERLEVSGPTAKHKRPVALLVALPVLVVAAALVFGLAGRTRVPLRPVTDWKPYRDPAKRLTVELPARWQVLVLGRQERPAAWYFAESRLLEIGIRRDDMVGLQLDLARGAAKARGVSPIQVVHEERAAKAMKGQGPDRVKAVACQVDGNDAFYSEFRFQRRSLLREVAMRGIIFTWMDGDQGFVAKCFCPAADYEVFKPVAERFVSTLKIE